MSTEETQNEIASSIITNVLAISDEQLAGLSDDAVLYEDGTCKITKAGILLKVSNYEY